MVISNNIQDYNFLLQMEVGITPKKYQFLPVELATKYYKKWQCDILCKNQNHFYYKSLHGQGTVEFQNGNIYQGFFQNGLMHGNGLYKWKSGLIYQGQFTNNTLTGKGTLTWPNGSFYVGQIVDGMRHGFGQYSSTSDKSNYKGQWQNGSKQGKGSLKFGNGSIYEGQFQKGLRSGLGKMRYPSGNQYEGEWKNDKKEGKGLMMWHNQHQKYVGQWKNDLQHGLGSYYWYEGKVQYKTIKTIFKGEWKQGKRQGFGAFFYNNGCRMEGNFVDNMKEGLCILTDEYSVSKTQIFKNDKILKPSNGLGGGINQKSRLSLIKKEGVLQLNEANHNDYYKLIHSKSNFIDQNIYNLLLRQNSTLRNWYKSMQNGAHKQYYTGVVMQSLWRLIKDIKISNEEISIARINRQYHKTKSSFFELELPNINKFKIVKEDTNILKDYGYQQIEWKKYSDHVMKLQFSNDAFQSEYRQNVDIQQINLNGTLIAHNPKQIILFRHFANYIIQIALIQNKHTTSQCKQTFRKCLEDLLSLVKSYCNQCQSFKTEKVVSEVITNITHNNQTKITVSPECSAINKTFFDILNENKQQLLNRIDQSLTVKQMYCLFIKCGLLRQPTEKILFLQKMERSTNAKTSWLKKDNKHLYHQLQKIVLASPYFSHVINYEMVFNEFDEMVYILLNRKLGATTEKQQYIKKYNEVVCQMITEVKNMRQQAEKQKIKVKRAKKASKKDIQRQRLLERIAEEKERLEKQKQREAELKRQQRERKLMKIQDVNIDDEQNDESEEYYD